MNLHGAEAFLTDPCAWADPGRAAAFLAPGLQGATMQRLMESPRTAARASKLLGDRLGHGSLDALGPVDRELALASAGSLRAVAAEAGAVWHAARVRTLLRAGEIAALAALHGSGIRAAALRHAALSPALDTAAGDTADSDTTAGGGLGEAISRDGARCLAAWIATLPAWAGNRVRLKWPDDAAPPEDARLRIQAVAVVRAVAAGGTAP